MLAALSFEHVHCWVPSLPGEGGEEEEVSFFVSLSASDIWVELKMC